MKYTIIDLQVQNDLWLPEYSLRDVVERLLSFHSIDNDMSLWDIYTLLDNWWAITSYAHFHKHYTWQPDLTYKLLKKYKQWKWARQFKKLAKKYTKLYYF